MRSLKMYPFKTTTRNKNKYKLGFCNNVSIEMRQLCPLLGEQESIVCVGGRGKGRGSKK